MHSDGVDSVHGIPLRCTAMEFHIINSIPFTRIAMDGRLALASIMSIRL